MPAIKSPKKLIEVALPLDDVNRLAFLSPDNAAVATATELCKTMLACRKSRTTSRPGR